MIYILLKGRCHEIFDFRFFHESVSPKPLSSENPITAFSNFFKKRSRTAEGHGGKFSASVNYISRKFASSVNDTIGTGGKICCQCR